MMKEENRQDKQLESIRADNKKAGVKFYLLIAASGVLGAFIGISCVRNEKSIWKMIEELVSFIMGNAIMLSVVVLGAMVVLTVSVVIWGMSVIRRERKHLLEQGQEDESEMDKMDVKISVCMKASSYAIAIMFFLFSIEVYLFSNINLIRTASGNRTADGKAVASILLVAAVVMISGLIMLIVLQQKIVDVIRFMNPEKRGSVYDIKFNKKWEESCDEREKLQIYQRGYRAYHSVTQSCPIIWAVCLLFGMFTGRGFSASVVVILIWLVLLWSYHRNCAEK